MSLIGARSLCDVAFERLERDRYFTLDADWIIPALCRAVNLEGPILEPCAGRGHMVCELRALGFVVRAADLYAHPNSLVPGIRTGVDVFDLKSLAGYRSVVTNFPTANRPPSLPISCRLLHATGRMWLSSRARNGVRPRLAARLCMRTRGSPERCG
jgi:hypothetical protein